jgi:hypothetical protein
MGNPRCHGDRVRLAIGRTICLAIIDISRLLRLQTGVAGGIGRLNQRLVAAYQFPEITPSKREKRQASEQVKEFVEGVILSLSTESIIRWNPPGGVLTG